MVRVYNSTLYDMVINNEIDGGIAIPTGYHVFVPQWMVEAEKIYRSGKFAGLTFREYIHKMAPDRQESQDVGK